MRNVPIFRVPIFRQVGYTLTELVIVVAIFGLIAAIATPATSSGPNQKLDLAAQEFAAAIRFARSESVRTGNPHGFQLQPGVQRIRVWRGDTATDPATIVYDVYDPIDKQVYDVTLDQQMLASANTITSNAQFRGACTTPEIVYFDPNGSPWCATPDNVLVESVELIFQTGTAQRTVLLDGITGRVSVL